MKLKEGCEFCKRFNCTLSDFLPVLCSYRLGKGEMDKQERSSTRPTERFPVLHHFSNAKDGGQVEDDGECNSTICVFADKPKLAFPSAHMSVVDFF